MGPDRDNPEDPGLARFGEALRRITGAAGPPPRDLLVDWRDGTTNDLMDWVAAHSTLDWALCITQIEAAEAIVDEPRDGVDDPVCDPADRTGGETVRGA